MSSTLRVTAIVSCSALAVAIVLLAIGEYRLVVRLRRNHIAIWKSIGEPSPWFGRLADLVSVSRFLKLRQYEQIDDASLVALANGLRRLTSLVYFLAASTILFLVLLKSA